MGSFETVIILDTLTSESPSLTYEESNKLYQEVMADYAHLISNYKKYKELRKNQYFNALKVKFFYAITCLKSQGEQWTTVFVNKLTLHACIRIDFFGWFINHT